MTFEVEVSPPYEKPAVNYMHVNLVLVSIFAGMEPTKIDLEVSFYRFGVRLDSQTWLRLVNITISTISLINVSEIAA